MTGDSNDRCCPTDMGPAKCAYDPTGDDFYIVGPYASKAGIVLVSDIFGMLPNSKRLADVLAEQGYLVVMPDFFGAKAWDKNKWPVDYASVEFQEFLGFARNFDLHKQRMDKAVALLRQLGCQKVGAVGMCWGATLPFMLAAEGRIDAAATAHPSFFTADALAAAKTPVLVMPSKDEPGMDVIEAAVNAHPIEPHTYQRFSALPHGFFGTRYDPDAYTPEEMHEVEAARQLLLDFFQKTLH